MNLLKVVTGLIFCFFCFSDFAFAAGKKKSSPYPVDICGATLNGPPFKIVGFKDYPPFSWAESDEEYFKNTGRKRYRYHGFIVDALKQALNDIHIIRIQDLAFDTFSEAQKAILHAKADLIFTSYYVDESKSGQDYVYPAYFGNPFIVVSRQTKKIEVEDPSELKGMKGVVRKEEEVEPLIRGILPTDTKLEVVDGPREAFRMLLSGDADFMITSPYAAEAEARRFNIKDKLYFGKKTLRHIKYFMAFSKMSKCRRYKDIFVKSFNERFENKSEIENLLHKYIKIWAEQNKNEPPLEYTPPPEVQQSSATSQNTNVTKK